MMFHPLPGGESGTTNKEMMQGVGRNLETRN